MNGYGYKLAAAVGMLLLVLGYWAITMNAVSIGSLLVLSAVMKTMWNQDWEVVLNFTCPDISSVVDQRTINIGE